MAIAGPVARRNNGAAAMLNITSGRIISNAARAACASVLLCLLMSCSDWPPVLRSQSDAHITVPANSSDPVAAQCQALRDQIRSNQESGREAPTISTSPQIVAAAEGRADQRIDELQRRLDTLDCPDEASTDSGRKTRLAPLPPAPNAPNP
jgi:hypothetical protein